ncbi:MAG: hypothetical protein FD143_2530 [Ignavibacteria bacterium]|nr:MAG: hypothetical protein FD143_2530 [Ignavibacteria bacterium]KAF0156540.1 MAG: hypothetical protein FD188_2934 [Ignavibacteria bacterium]
MSKQQKKVSSGSNKSKEIGFSLSKLIPEKFQTPVLLFMLLILILIFFSPVLFGDKTTSAGDLIQVKSLREYSNKERDGHSLWNPHIFCGMPAVVTSASPRMFDLTAAAYSYTSRIYSATFTDYNAIYTFSFVILGLTAFFFMRSFGAGRLLSFFVAAAVIFSTGITMLFYIGHITKLMSLSVLPFILMMLFKFQKKIKLLDVLLFVLALHLLALGAHVQIVFYFALTAAIYFIFFFIRAFVSKDTVLKKQLLKSVGITTAAGIIALSMSLDTYSQILEYKPYSTRGTKSITETQDTGAAAINNSYQYATSWSFSPQELTTLVIPSYFGFGNSVYKGELTQNQEVEVNTYFGQMESVDAAMYMGIVILALAFFALITRWREPKIQFFSIVIALFVLISFGKNFPLVYNLLYYNLPQFDNFRAPVMILHVLQIVFPILAGLGVMKIISLREEKNITIVKSLRIAAIIFSGIFVLSLFFGGSISGWMTDRINTYVASLGQSPQGQQMGQMFTALAPYISNMFRGDFQIAFALLALTFGISYAYAASKINKELLVAALIVFALIDLFRISTRGASYIDKAQADQLFIQPQYVSAIKRQNDKEPFRIINLKREGMGSLSNNANLNVYFLQEDFSGYSAVKPRSYQDIMDVVGPVNITLWRMLGVKYVVADQPFGAAGFTPIQQTEKEIVYRNDTALPRIYFVEGVEKRAPADMLNEIKSDSFDPKKLAFVETLDFKFDKADSTSECKIVQYKDEHVIAEVDAKGNNFLFFGTTYLPGWIAYVNGAETKTYKVNHGFIGIVVPQGKHKVEFVYEPKGFTFGKYLSLALNVLLFIGIGFAFFFSRKKGTPENK